MSDHPYPLLPLNDAETATTIAAMNDGISAVGAHLVIQVLRQNGWQSAPDAAAKDAEIERLNRFIEATYEVTAERADRAEIQRRRLRDRMHGLAQQWRGGRAPGPEFGQALEDALDQLKET